MAITRRRMQGLSPEDVFEVLADGASYDGWVVGTRAVRAVDDGWPAVGTRLHYTVLRGPLRHDGHTTAQAYRPAQRLELEAHAWPMGTAKVIITAERLPDDDVTLVSIEEHPHRGLAARLHNPVLDLLVKARNVETLRRLEAHVRGRRSADG